MDYTDDVATNVANVDAAAAADTWSTPPRMTLEPLATDFYAKLQQWASVLYAREALVARRELACSQWESFLQRRSLLVPRQPPRTTRNYNGGGGSGGGGGRRQRNSKSIQQPQPQQ